MSFPWNELLYVGKWLLIVLFYVALFVVLVTVRREMAQFRRTTGAPTSSAAGRLRVLDRGGDATFNRDEVVGLPNEVLLGSNPSQIGRDGLLLRDAYVSSRHARLRWDGAHWWVQDLGSTNGTFVNQRRVAPEREEMVPFGATLQVGDIRFQLLE